MVFVYQHPCGKHHGQLEQFPTYVCSSNDERSCPSKWIPGHLLTKQPLAVQPMASFRLQAFCFVIIMCAKGKISKILGNLCICGLPSRADQKTWKFMHFLRIRYFCLPEIPAVIYRTGDMQTGTEAIPRISHRQTT